MNTIPQLDPLAIADTLIDNSRKLSGTLSPKEVARSEYAALYGGLRSELQSCIIWLGANYPDVLAELARTRQDSHTWIMGHAQELLAAWSGTEDNQA